MPTYRPLYVGLQYSEALTDAYVHTPADDPVLVTLELHHADWVEPVRVVNDWAALDATLEADAPTDPSTQVEFAGIPFTFSRPAETDSGAPAAVTISVDNLSTTITQMIMDVQESEQPIAVYIRTYLRTDTTAPHELPVLKMWVQSPVQIDSSTARLTCSFGDLTNRRFPRLLWRRATPPANSYYSDTILQTSVTTAQLIDVSPLANALSKAGSGGGPAYTATDPLFGGPVYDLSDTTHRVLLTSGDGFIASNFGAGEWTAELQIKGVGPGASGNFMALSALSFGLWTTGFDIGFNVANIGGGSYTVGGATLNPAQFDHVVVQRNNTADPALAFLELGINGVRVGVSTTFAKTHPINTGAGFAMLLGYFTTGARLKANEIRIVKSRRVYNMSTDYATPLAYTAQSSPHPVGP